jgi:hypothetical protein
MRRTLLTLSILAVILFSFWFLGCGGGGGETPTTTLEPATTTLTPVSTTTGPTFTLPPATTTTVTPTTTTSTLPPLGAHWTQISAAALNFGRGGMGYTVHNGKMFLVGGTRTPGGRTNEVWSSTNGAEWTPVGRPSELLKMFGHSLVSYNSKLWVIFGSPGGGLGATNEVWSSLNDGVTWESVFYPVSKRYAHGSAVFDAGAGEAMWVIGGTTESTATKEVNSFKGGAIISKNNPDSFTAVWAHGCVAFAGKLWTIGGIINDIATNEVQYSTDGATWSHTIGQFPPRSFPVCLVLGGKIWLIGGGGTAALNDVWSSADGLNWEQVTAAGEFPARSYAAGYAFDGRLWITNGFTDAAYTTVNDVWVSE